MSRSRRDHVVRTPTGETWAMEKRDGFWGLYSMRPNPHAPYFVGLIKALMDAGSHWDKFRILSPQYPFTLLGYPGLKKVATQMVYPKEVSEILLVGVRLETLTLRLRALAAERDCFRVLAELEAPHAER